jgi:AraC-like DNA-binding protein/ligand-binding sensor protein
MDVKAINRKIFAELGREKRLTQYHEIIYKLLGIVVDFINSDGESLKLSRMRHFNPYCAMLRSTNSGFAACRDCDRKHAHRASVKHDIVKYKCHAGLTEIFVPFYSNSGDYIGCMTSGQFFLDDDTPADDETVREVALAHKLDPEVMCDLYHRTKVLSPLQLEGIIEYLNTIGQIIVETHNKLLFMELIDAPARIPLIKKYVEENYMKKITIADTARKFFMSPGYFSHFFRKEVGVSFMTFVNMYRISQAEEMLRETGRNITEIAFLTGFGSLSQFNRTFKDINGVSPREFRKK